MSFSDDFTSCLAPFPAPGNVLDSAEEFVDWLEQLHSAWENSGGDEEMLMTALIAAGAVTGIDEEAIGALAGITVLAYVAKCAACLVSAAASSMGSAIWDLISSTQDSFVKDQLTVAANDQGVPPESDSQTA